MADPGGICISRGVHDHVMRKLAYRFEDLGEKSVKNIAQPIRVFRLKFEANEPLESKAQEASGAGLITELVSNETTPSEIAPVSAAIDPQPELLFWESIKDSARASDYTAYLSQYPEGLFVALARARLDETLSDDGVQRTPHDEEVELLFWESVRNSENPESLRAYLEKFPNGDFKALAEIRLTELAA